MENAKKNVRFFLPVMTMKNGVYRLTIQTESEGNHEKADPIPIIITTSNRIRIVSIENMEETCKEDTLNETRKILNELNEKNWETIVTKMVTIKIESKEQLKGVAEEIHQRALNDSNLINEYAVLCATMMKNESFNSSLKCLDATLLQVLLPKMYDLFYSYKTNLNEKSTETERTASLSAKQNPELLANSTFISKLYTRGVLPESIFWSFLMDLKKENGNTQIRCLANMLKLAGTKLSETYSLSRIVGHLLLLENDKSRVEVMCTDLRSLIRNVKVIHNKFWIHKVPDRVIKENLRLINQNLIRPNKINSEWKEYDSCLMAECTLDDCRNLLNEFVNVKCPDDIERLLSPALNALLNTDQLRFANHMIITAVSEKNPRTRWFAAKLLADLVRTRLLTKHVVYLGFDKVRNEEATFRDLVTKLEAEYTSQLNAKRRN